MYKQKKPVKKYVWALYHELVLFLRYINSFRYIPENEIKGGILGCTPSYVCFLLNHTHATGINDIPINKATGYTYEISPLLNSVFGKKFITR